ncbi:hypothetical protein V6N12_029699 [Hibiscus sabdariffa]|uniref:Gnk2-homologous domain-containing protein n=1 Tax=Hibiscus sabdariffa TaxID=183260 RepID=A0ABR2CWW1_9ROSI
MCRAKIVKPVLWKQAARFENVAPTIKVGSSGKITVFSSIRNQKFFGHIDNGNTFFMWNLNNVSEPQAFNHKTKQLLTELANEAYANPKLYAAGETEFYGSNKLYGLTQCTRDLSASDCKKCLDGIIGELPSCCDGKQGGRVVGGSCYFRYEIYPFLNSL